MKVQTAINMKGAKDTYIKVYLLEKAVKDNYKKDVIRMEIKSKTDHIAGDMTAEEAIVLANGLINAVTLKHVREKRL